MSDARIRMARQTQFEEAATDTERGWLSLGRQLGRWEFVKKIQERIRLRVELGLPQLDCLDDDERCSCLSEALDAALGSSETGPGSGPVSQAARALHAERLERRSKPEPALPEPTVEVTSEVVTPAPPSPLFDPDISDAKPRIVKRTHKWYDPPPGILNQRF